eukprot:CAMPEP_0170605580 /NCGR_PEP_ID=MMETSP0224-20130122/20048_1 /TAXON_ID=285029 /ORGANISM="Togula jolla, Strain CCCM 725" /LENGTH=41 /DNA_ID= /DNA_START= /DNA_END= /DNA_ORIENTATION=
MKTSQAGLTQEKTPITTSTTSTTAQKSQAVSLSPGMESRGI